MLNKRNILRGLRNSGLALVLIRRWFPWSAVRDDPECRHLVRAWSSGRLHRVSIKDLFPGIDNVSIVLRKAEGREVGWFLDLHELVHVLSIVKLTKAKQIL